MTDDNLAGDGAVPVASVSPAAASDAPFEPDPRTGPVDPAGVDAVAAEPEAEPGKRSKKKDPSPPGSIWKELPILIVIAFVLAILLKTFLVQAFSIPSGSMENTLQINDRVMVNKVVYHIRDIKRGDIVVFNGVDSFTPEVTIAPPSGAVAKSLSWVASLVGFAPPSEKDFIKRVIGIPGDHVVCCDAKGRITVNGVALDEPYLYPGNVPSADPFDITVPAGRLWVMGDHRDMSSDSRAHVGQPGGGTIPEDKVIGRAFAVIWPYNHWQWLSGPATFDQPALNKVSAAASSPLVYGFAAAFPIVGLRRRRRRRRFARSGVAPSS